MLVSEFKDEQGNTINVPIYIEEGAIVNRAFIDTNKISTVFGRDDFRDYINRQLRNKNLVRIKDRSTQTSEGPTLIVGAYEMDASDNSIAKKSEKSTETAKKASDDGGQRGKHRETSEGAEGSEVTDDDVVFSRKQQATDDSEHYEPYTVTINVKEKDNGEFVYSFNAEKESSTRRTLHADVNTRKGANGELFLDNSIPQNSDMSTASGEKTVGNSEFAERTPGELPSGNSVDHRYMSPDLWHREGEVASEQKYIKERCNVYSIRFRDNKKVTTSLVRHATSKATRQLDAITTDSITQKSKKSTETAKKVSDDGGTAQFSRKADAVGRQDPIP